MSNFYSALLGLIAIALGISGIIHGFLNSNILFILAGIGALYFGYTCVRYLK